MDHLAQAAQRNREAVAFSKDGDVQSCIRLFRMALQELLLIVNSNGRDNQEPGVTGVSVTAVSLEGAWSEDESLDCVYSKAFLFDVSGAQDAEAAKGFCFAVIEFNLALVHHLFSFGDKTLLRAQKLYAMSIEHLGYFGNYGNAGVLLAALNNHAVLSFSLMDLASVQAALVIWNQTDHRLPNQEGLFTETEIHAFILNVLVVQGFTASPAA